MTLIKSKVNGLTFEADSYEGAVHMTSGGQGHLEIASNKSKQFSVGVSFDKDGNIIRDEVVDAKAQAIEDELKELEAIKKAEEAFELEATTARSKKQKPEAKPETKAD